MVAHDTFRYMDTNAQNNSSLRKKDLCARMKVAQDEFFRGPARLMPRYAVTTTYGNIEQKRFSVLHIKKEKGQG